MFNVSEKPDFIKLQYQFTAHIRNPGRYPCPSDIEPRRMNIYTELLYNNVENFMSSSFPILRAITAENNWHGLIRDYFEFHRASTPLFHEMAGEFIKYLAHEYQSREDDYPFLLELAHYEWVELALSMAEQTIDPCNISSDDDLLQGFPVLSPLAWPLSYRYPVQKLGPGYLPSQPPDQPTYLIVYRNRHDDVHFLELNPVTALLLRLIQADIKQNTHQMLTTIAQQLQHPNEEAVIQGGLQVLHDLNTRDVILGVSAV